MTKAERQACILELIRIEAVHTQHDLLEKLSAQGVEATQVTVSRDLHELGVVKSASGYRALKGVVQAQSLEHFVTEFLLTAAAAQNLVVLRTAPGNAMSLARALDEASLSEVVGTVAGDDTVLVVAPDAATANRLAGKLMALRP